MMASVSHEERFLARLDRAALRNDNNYSLPLNTESPPHGKLVKSYGRGGDAAAGAFCGAGVGAEGGGARVNLPSTIGLRSSPSQSS
jgi:hypothetical protein